MRESSLVPTNLMEWPLVSGLLPEQKFIFERLWASGWIKSTGWGELQLLSLAASISLTSAATLTGIFNLCALGLIVFDEETNEIFISEWFRFHKFKGIGVAIAKKEIQKIRSIKIKNLILDKSSTCFPTSSLSSSSSPKKAEEGAQSFSMPKPSSAASEDNLPEPEMEEGEKSSQAYSMVQPFLLNAVDKEIWKNVNSKFSDEEILVAIHKVLGEGKMPYVSTIQKKLQVNVNSSSPNHQCQFEGCLKYASARTSWGEWRCAQHI
jgi:hypothetical protein